MKKFLKIFGIFIFVLWVCALTLDVIITNGLRHFDTRRLSTWNDIYDGKVDGDIIALGSSRIWSGVNTYVLDSMLKCNSYNIGLDGHPIDLQIVRYNTYRRFNGKPKILLLNADFLSTLGNTSEEGYEREQFFPYIWDDSLINVVKERKKITILDRYVPLYRYIGYRKWIDFGWGYYFGRKDLVEGGMHKGHLGVTYGWSRGSLDTDTIFSASTDATAAQMMDKFIQDLTADSVLVILMKTPVYLPLRDKFCNIEFSDSVYDSFAQKYNIPVLDFYFEELCSDSTNFYNPSHMNKKGSEVFTRRLCETIIEQQLYP